MKFGLGVKERIKTLRSPAKINGNKIKAVLFDMDGVLINSSDQWHEAFNLTLKKFGSPCIARKEFIENNWGKSVDENIKLFSVKFRNKKLDAEAAKFCNSKIKELYPTAKAFDGAREILPLVKHRFKTALVTNSQRLDVFDVLKKNSLEMYFDVVLTIENVKRGKPDPEIVKKACKLLRIKPKNAVLIGDTASDMEAGKAAGCNLIGIGIGGDAKIEKISDAAKILKLDN